MIRSLNTQSQFAHDPIPAYRVETSVSDPLGGYSLKELLPLLSSRSIVLNLRSLLGLLRLS